VIAGLVLAAGAGQRFGGGKMLAPLRGRPLLAYAIDAMRASVARSTVVVLGDDHERVRAEVELSGMRVVVNDDPGRGLSSSLRIGLDALDGSEVEAVVITLGDQPLIGAAAIDRVVAGGRGRPAARATYGGVPGHPVLLSRSLLARARELSGDVGARALLDGPELHHVACDDLASPQDVDRVEDLEALERRRGDAGQPS
jgi:nicotine blue oxidoreductase